MPQEIEKKKKKFQIKILGNLIKKSIELRLKYQKNTVYGLYLL